MDRNTDSSNTASDTTTALGCGLSAQAIAWVQEHGSEYLRSCVEKGNFCRYGYNEERAKLEAPRGWSLFYEAAFLLLNPPAEAMELLAKAREQFPQVRLWQIRRDYYVEYVAAADAPWPDGHRLVFDDRIRIYKDYFFSPYG